MKKEKVTGGEWRASEMLYPVLSEEIGGAELVAQPSAPPPYPDMGGEHMMPMLRISG